MVTDMAAMSTEAMAGRLAPLLERGEANLADLALPVEKLRRLGFEIHSGIVRIPADVERLEAAAIEAALSHAAKCWLVQLKTYQVVGSTSSLLNEHARTASVDGLVRLAELQLEGRGRRGRGWISPYGNNLAISLGARIPQRPDALGGFSLCMGLAVADHLETLGLGDVELKWPNDVLIEGRKVCGILVELHAGSRSTEAVIGVGVNVRLPAEARVVIDQPVADLAELAWRSGKDISRNRLAAGLLSSMVEFIGGFSRQGFAPMVQSFDAKHRFHGKTCAVLLGGDTVSGKVQGVTERGELLLEVEGELQRFNSGEVSLRPV